MERRSMECYYSVRGLSDEQPLRTTSVQQTGIKMIPYAAKRNEELSYIVRGVVPSRNAVISKTTRIDANESYMLYSL